MSIKNTAEIDKLQVVEEQAWKELRAYIDFTDKCKGRVYRRQKPYSPTPVPEVEAEFTRLIRRWEKSRAELEAAKRDGATSPVYNGSRPEADETLPLPSRSRSAV